MAENEDLPTDTNDAPPDDADTPEAPVLPGDGIRSEQFWLHLGTQAVVMLGAFGILNSHDALLWSGWISKSVAAASVLIAVIWNATHWIKHQTMRRHGPDSHILSMLLVILCVGFLAAPVCAQSAPPYRPPLVPVTGKPTVAEYRETTGQQIGLINFGGRRGQQQQQPAAPAGPQQADPAIISALQSLAATHAALLAHLQAHGQITQPPSTPAAPATPAAPQMFLIQVPQQQQGPLYQPVVPGQPLYQPVAPGQPLYAPTPPGQPFYQPAVPGQPLFAPSVPGQPLIHIQTPGGPIIQVVPPSTLPAPTLPNAPPPPPGVTKPAPAAPAPAAPAPPGLSVPGAPLIMPGAPTYLPPAPMPQRYTTLGPLVPITQSRR